jgi:adenine deaminase
VTINPAKQLGIDDKVGSIEVGKSGDMVLFDKHPLSNYSKVLKVWIDGHEYFDRDKDFEMRKELEQKKKTLLEKEKAAASKVEAQSKTGQKPREKENPDSVSEAAR